MPKDRHLKQLPVKSFAVAKGDVVGGLIYIMDKPLGIEEGMVGISIDSEAYRAFVKAQLDLLKKQAHPNQALQARFDIVVRDTLDNKSEEEQMDALLQDRKPIKKRQGMSLSDLRKIFFSFSKLHEVSAFRAYIKNEGCGGLLFSEYEKACGIKGTDHFSVSIKKIIKGPKDPTLPKDLRKHNKVYMVKQDGEMVLGGTGPGIRKMMKTTTGKGIQRAFNPFVILLTGGLSALVGAVILAAWRIAMLRRNKPSVANSDAIVETLATKIAAIKGFHTQDIETIEGTYPDGTPKIATLVTWTPGCRDLSGRLEGGTKDWTSVLVKQDKDGKPLLDKEGMMVSDNTIEGLGESLLSFISLGDRDGIGKNGQNKAVVKLDHPHKGKTHQFYGIDFGKAYRGKNPIVTSLQDDFSFHNPTGAQTKFVNITMLYDTPLHEKMQGVYLLAALRNQLAGDEKEAIALEYEAIGHKAFADKLRKTPKTDKGNDDLRLIKEEENKYREKAKRGDLTKAQQKQYLAYAKRLNKMYRMARDTDAKILEVFEKRLHLLPHQIDFLDNLEKLTSLHVSTTSSDNKVRLNHIQVKREGRMAWQIEKNEDGTFQVVCTEIDEKNRAMVYERLKAFPELAEKAGPDLNMSLTGEELKRLSAALTELEVAKARGLALASDETVKVKPPLEHGEKPIQKKGKEKRPLSLQYERSAPVSEHKVDKLLHEAPKQLKELSDFLKDADLKQYDITRTGEIECGAYEQAPGIAMTFNSPYGAHEIYAKEKEDGVHYSIAQQVPLEAFEIEARNLARLVIDAAKPNLVFDISVAPEEKRPILQQALQAAIQEAVLKKRFTEENQPKVILQAEQPASESNMRFKF